MCIRDRDLSTGITVSHDNEYISNEFTVSPEQIDTNQLGIHKITYTAIDNWNRTTTKVRTIEVVSKVKSNSIEVYNPSENSTDLLFKIDFDASAKKFVIKNSIQDNNSSEDSSDNNEVEASRTGEVESDEGNDEAVSYTHLMTLQS